MKACPFGLAAWMCTYHVHLGREELCQDKRRAKLDKEQDLQYVGFGYDKCEGFEVDKRFKSFSDKVRHDSK